MAGSLVLGSTSATEANAVPLHTLNAFVMNSPRKFSLGVVVRLEGFLLGAARTPGDGRPRAAMMWSWETAFTFDPTMRGYVIREMGDAVAKECSRQKREV